MGALMGPGLFLAGLVVMLAATKKVLSMATFGLRSRCPAPAWRAWQRGRPQAWRSARALGAGGGGGCHVAAPRRGHVAALRTTGARPRANSRLRAASCRNGPPPSRHPVACRDLLRSNRLTTRRCRSTSASRLRTRARRKRDRERAGGRVDPRVSAPMEAFDDNAPTIAARRTSDGEVPPEQVMAG